MLEHAIETGRGGVYLRLTPEQYARLRRSLSALTREVNMSGAKSIKELEGSVVSILIPSLGESFQRVTLYKVEDAGVWIESQAATGKVMENAKITMAPKSPVFFAPWTSITLIMGSLEVPPSISDKAALIPSLTP